MRRITAPFRRKLPERGALTAPSLASVFDPGDIVDLEEHRPISVGDRQEAVLFLELLLQGGAFKGR